MTDLQLEVGEGILLQTNDAGLYDGKNEIDIEELYLTNKNIIYVHEKSAGFFKSETVVERIPLSNIAVINGVTQVELVDDDDYGKSLQIIYTSGKRELLELNVSPKKQYPVWKNAIADGVLKATAMAGSIEKEKKCAFCTNCGEKLNSSARFCGVCGTPVYNNPMADPETQKSENTQNSSFVELHSTKEGTYRLTIAEKTISLRKRYIISDHAGNVLYTAKKEGLPKIPQVSIYKQDNQVGEISKEIFANPALGNPTYTLYWHDKRIASLIQRYSLKPKFNIPENGWIFDIGMMKSTAYDNKGDIAVEIQYMMSTGKPSFIIEYSNKKNEVYAILLAFVSIMVFHMG